MKNTPSKKMDEFLDKVDKLCFEYQYEMYPVPDDEFNRACICIKGVDEVCLVLYIDGDGRGK